VILRMHHSCLKRLEGGHVQLLFLIFVCLNSVVNFRQTNLFVFLLSEFQEPDNYGFH
jgi:hypothetical protein